MIIRHTRGTTTWIDLESPTEDELTSVMREFGIDERVHGEILTPTPYPLAIAFPGYAYLVLHFPTADQRDGARVQELDLVIGKNFIITSRYEIIDPIYTLHKVFEAEQLLGTVSKKSQTEALLARIMDRLYAATATEIEETGYKLERIERDIFAGKERRAVRPISEASRVLLRFETALARHESPLTDFLTFLSAPAFFGTKFDEYAAHIEAARSHAAALVTSYRAVAAELRSTNTSLLTSSQNRIIQVLTVFSFVSYPPHLIAGIFAMETSWLPIVGSPNDFAIVIGLMVASVLFMLSVARFNRWL